MIYTTLNRIRQHLPCASGWRKLLTHLNKTEADDEPLALVTVLESNGLDDALWCLRAEPQHSAIWRLLAVHYARKVQLLMTDPRSLNALNVAERHARGLATDAELFAALGAARSAAWDAARDTALGAALGAVLGAALGAVLGAALGAVLGAVLGAALGAALGAVWDAAREQQADDLRVVLTHYHAEPGKDIHGWEGMK